ncbi:hypothetical protein CLHUN_21420 [Ruminiclostridium hungatei]|uniref:Uncharacterized protein n=1 Tax=Ruminiclostridium hungatei TaxID=48256 RepID=A0A1V4SJ30_RUMHU|nr:hypothetical protein [Ruminiclostridium hungatei]OPX43899.1 hypothetical protein CLHUN_21420 [Ruminiclostridium hungatei]
MISRENCALRSSQPASEDQVCMKLQVVEDAKTDMEYNCPCCRDK